MTIASELPIPDYPLLFDIQRAGAGPLQMAKITIELPPVWTDGVHPAEGVDNTCSAHVARPRRPLEPLRARS